MYEVAEWTQTEQRGPRIISLGKVSDRWMKLVHISSVKFSLKSHYIRYQVPLSSTQSLIPGID